MSNVCFIFESVDNYRKNLDDFFFVDCDDDDDVDDEQMTNTDINQVNITIVQLTAECWMNCFRFFSYLSRLSGLVVSDCIRFFFQTKPFRYLTHTHTLTQVVNYLTSEAI